MGGDTQIVSIANIRQEARPDDEYTRPNTTIVPLSNDLGGPEVPRGDSRGPTQGGYPSRSAGTNGDADYDDCRRRESSRSMDERMPTGMNPAGIRGNRYDNSVSRAVVGGPRHGYNGPISESGHHRRSSTGTNDHRPERLMRGGVTGSTTSKDATAYYEGDESKMSSRRFR